MKIAPFGKTWDGRPITSYMLENGTGAYLEILDYGGKVRNLVVPDIRGTFENVALSLDFAKPGFGGSLIGRYANRIAGGRFTLDGTAYVLDCNIAPNGIPCLLHGGAKGFHDQIWQVAPCGDSEEERVRLTYVSPAGEGGFPGTLAVDVVYAFTKRNTWRIEWMARTDAPTPVNFTHHVYFNLSGTRRAPVTNQVLTLTASHYTPLGAGQIPTGEIADVTGTPFDFRTPQAIGSRLDGQYDHNFVLDAHGGELACAARVEDPISRRTLETWTTEPALQVYAGGAFTSALKDQFARELFPFAGLALETQHHPDAVNQPEFPDTVLHPGETFHSVTEYRFGV